MNRLLKIGLLGVGLAAGAIFFFKVPVSSILPYGLLLACPLLHLFMGHGEHSNKSSEHKH